MTKIVKYLFLACIVALVFLPLLIIVNASFKNLIEIGTDFALKPPASFNLDNYKIVVEKGNIFRGFKNSMILVIASIATNIIIGTMTAYAVTRFKFKLRPVIMGLFLVGMLVPQLITEIARFQVISALNLYNTLLAPIIIYSATDLVQLYIYMQFLEKIPRAIDESAMLDGCGYFKVFTRMIFPLLLPAMATVAIIKTVDVINDMYIPKLYMPSKELSTLTTTLLTFSNSKYSSWNYLSAAIVLVMLPTILIYLFFQKYIFEGIVAGTVKE